MQTEPASDAMITELFDALPESVLWLKPVWSLNNEIIDFRIAYCNHGASRLLHTQKELLQGQRILQTSLVEEEYKQQIFKYSHH
jgi:PAS domain-containing protein